MILDFSNQWYSFWKRYEIDVIVISYGPVFVIREIVAGIWLVEDLRSLTVDLFSKLRNFEKGLMQFNFMKYGKL